MELEEMKNIWNELAKTHEITSYNYSPASQVEYNRKTNIFRKAEIIGLLIAYAFSGFILYNFNILDNWYLRLCAVILIAYLLIMPLYTFMGIRKMKHIDVAVSNYKTVLEHFYATKKILKKAEKVSFIASPFLLIASIAILTKLLTNQNIFSMNVHLPVIILIGIAFVVAVLFNIWAFKKRDKQLHSVKQLLEED